LKAVSPTKKNGGAIVCDLTAGLGRDSAIIALGGAQVVHMVERDPVVAMALEAALRRNTLVKEAATIDYYDLNNFNEIVKIRSKELSTKLILHVGEGVDFCKCFPIKDQQQPDVCYLDPMFPPKKKSAAVKRNMQILQSLLGRRKETEEEVANSTIELLEAALELAKVRVVLKRPVRFLMCYAILSNIFCIFF